MLGDTDEPLDDSPSNINVTSSSLNGPMQPDVASFRRVLDDIMLATEYLESRAIELNSDSLHRISEESQCIWREIKALPVSLLTSVWHHVKRYRRLVLGIWRFVRREPNVTSNHADVFCEHMNVLLETIVGDENVFPNVQNSHAGLSHDIFHDVEHVNIATLIVHQTIQNTVELYIAWLSSRQSLSSVLGVYLTSLFIKRDGGFWRNGCRCLRRHSSQFSIEANYL